MHFLKPVIICAVVAVVACSSPGLAARSHESQAQDSRARDSRSSLAERVTALICTPDMPGIERRYIYVSLHGEFRQRCAFEHSTLQQFDCGLFADGGDTATHRNTARQFRVMRELELKPKAAKRFV